MRKQNIKQPGNFKVLGTGSKFRTKDNPSGRPRPCADPKKHLQKQLQSKQKKTPPVPQKESGMKPELPTTQKIIPLFNPVGN